MTYLSTKHRRVGPSVERLEDRKLLTGIPYMVADINTHAVVNEFADPYLGAPFVAAGGSLYFVAHDSEAGHELWRSDGTDAGTARLADITPGVTSSGIHGLKQARDRVFFYEGKDFRLGAARACPYGPCGRQLWTTDGTEQDTLPVSEWLNIDEQFHYAAPVEVNNTFLLFGDSGLWLSDGTPEGTQQINDARVSFFPFSQVIEHIAYFYADGSDGSGLWQSDGTVEGTNLVTDLGTGIELTNPRPVAAIGPKTYFTAADSPTTSSLWVTDSTEGGTQKLLVGSVRWPTEVNGQLYFVSGNPGDVELWKSDGTEEGTHKVINVTGFGGLQPTDLINVGGQLYFTAVDAESGRELWISDGTEAGTRLVKDIVPGPEGGSVSSLLEIGGKLVFTANNGEHGKELWTSDGTEVGTQPMTDLVHERGPGTTTTNGDTLYFPVDTGEGRVELWKSDGTAKNTARFTEVVVGTQWAGPHDLGTFGSQLIFAAHDGELGSELWKSDGTRAGTKLIKDILPGQESSSPREFTEFDGRFYFSAEDNHGEELWVSDGSSEGTLLLKDIHPNPNSYHRPHGFAATSDALFFVADDGETGDELWKTDGTETGTVLVKDIYPGPHSSYLRELTAVGNTLFFRAGHQDGEKDYQLDEELWMSDGTEAGTVRVRDIYDGIMGSDPDSLTPFGDKLFFSAEDAASGREPWISDGTEVGTMRLADIAQGPEASIMEYGAGATELGGELYFFAREERLGPTSLWGTDGTVAGTRKVADGFEPVEAAPLVMNGHLSFTTYEEAGIGLWKSDGTPAGTQKVSVEFDHRFFDPYGNTAVFDGELYFRSGDDEAGLELWRTDGSAEGTERVADIHPGKDGSWPSGFTVVGDTLFFGADDGLHGDELWAISTQPLPGDANQDGAVSFGDFLILAENFGKANAVWSEGDFNGDEEVTFADFLILALNFGDQRPVANASSFSVQAADDVFASLA